MNIRDILPRIVWVTCSILLGYTTFGQSNKNKATTPLIDLSSYRKYYNFLNDPSLQQRKVSTQGNTDATIYLANNLRDLGLKDIGRGYKQSFNIPLGQIISYESTISINNQIVKVPTEGYPLPFSDTHAVINSIIGLNNSFHNIWILPAYKNVSETKLTELQKEEMLYLKAKDAKERGAIGVIFYNNLGDDFVLPFKDNGTQPNVGIPVYELAAKIVRDRIMTQRKLSNVALHAKMKPVLGTLSNVIGMIDNQAKESIIISSNIDGLSDDHYISTHNTASGMALVLQLAQELKKRKANYNYIIVFYNATNNSLEGSKKLLADPIIKNSKVVAALHYQDIGVMDETNMIRVSGVGTFVGWRQFFASNTNSGIGYFLENRGATPSDIQQYYQFKIPYLAFASNNYEGNNNLITQKVSEAAITNTVLKSLEILSGIDQVRSMPTFSQTEDIVPITTATHTASKNNKQFQKLQNPVSLGVLPDLDHKESGILIGQVNKGTPADIGGLMVGDIIMQIRNFPVQHYDDYLAALNHFKKGDKIFVKIKRKGNIIQKVVTF